MARNLNEIMAKKSELRKRTLLTDYIRDFANHEMDALTVEQLHRIAVAIEKEKTHNCTEHPQR